MLKDIIKKVAMFLSKKADAGGPETQQSSEETLDQKEPIDLGKEPEEIQEHKHQKKVHKKEETDEPSVVVTGDVDKNEAALQYMIELIQNGKKVEEALALTKEAFYKEATFKKFCHDIKKGKGSDNE